MNWMLFGKTIGWSITQVIVFSFDQPDGHGVLFLIGFCFQRQIVTFLKIITRDRKFFFIVI